ncbi:MAG: HPr kinase/phosphatase C-terminal domain-containing protein [Proteobacteria bacterium]|nr:HPr kinase/phosphatase C-terminal domain-containing protein [Pseudomonadota bacterium]
MLVHATCVALMSGRRWRALLLRGPSGAGKSDVALRLLEAGGRLVSDDQTHLARIGRAVVATPPRTLAGLIEARGIGIVKLRQAQLLAEAPVALLVDLVPADKVERLPDPAHETVLGIALPKVALAAFEASIVTKLRLALVQTANA